MDKVFEANAVKDARIKWGFCPNGCGNLKHVLTHPNGKCNEVS